MKRSYKATTVACFCGYVVQAIVNNFVPLLLLTFHVQYGIKMAQITFLITVNFIIQLAIDAFSALFVDKIGYRASAVLAHITAAAGLISLAVLPEVLPNPFVGLLAAVSIYALGGGLLEVIVSPILEACPTDNKETAMSLLHSFYCWGHVAVVLFSTLFFAVFGISKWKYMAVIWALIPLGNMLLFSQVPIYPLIREGENGMKFRQLLSKKMFWLLFMMMVCAGASEQAVSQWSSTFAEQGLGVNKSVGDLMGPMAFAVLMGTSRLLYGKYGEKLDLDKFMKGSCLLCIVSYLCIALVPFPAVGLLGCAVCGFSVGIMWPGTFSKAAASLKGGGTLMFALLALAGDLGCSGGPTLAGLVSSVFDNNLRIGIFAAIIFPVLMLAGKLLQEKFSGQKRNYI
ncbi:MAG: MFS transporter [Lachnospiraceae bacterium]|nr:MFS transporter [Lachnospiraceae bacterium]